MNRYTKNINIPTLDTLNVFMTMSTYSRTESGKHWRENPDETKTERISGLFYFNCCDSVPFFKSLGGSERCEWGYTIAGYLITRITSISPDRAKKVVRTFRFARKD